MKGWLNQQANTKETSKLFVHAIMAEIGSATQNPKHKGQPNSSARNSFLHINHLLQSSHK